VRERGSFVVDNRSIINIIISYDTCVQLHDKLNPLDTTQVSHTTSSNEMMDRLRSNLYEEY
jgi:hypothetical protein